MYKIQHATDFSFFIDYGKTFYAAELKLLGFVSQTKSTYFSSIIKQETRQETTIMMIKPQEDM